MLEHSRRPPNAGHRTLSLCGSQGVTASPGRPHPEATASASTRCADAANCASAGLQHAGGEARPSANQVRGALAYSHSPRAFPTHSRRREPLTAAGPLTAPRRYEAAALSSGCPTCGSTPFPGPAPTLCPRTAVRRQRPPLPPATFRHTPAKLRRHVNGAAGRQARPAGPQRWTPILTFEASPKAAPIDIAESCCNVARWNKWRACSGTLLHSAWLLVRGPAPPAPSRRWRGHRAAPVHVCRPRGWGAGPGMQHSRLNLNSDADVSSLLDGFLANRVVILTEPKLKLKLTAPSQSGSE